MGPSPDAVAPLGSLPAPPPRLAAWAWWRLALRAPRGRWGTAGALLGLALELGAYAALVPLAAQAGPRLGQPQALAPLAGGIVLAFVVKGLGAWLRQSGAQAVAAEAALAARLGSMGGWPQRPGLEAKAPELAAGLHADANALRLALSAWLDALPLGLGAIALAVAAAVATSWRLVLAATLAAALMAALARALGAWTAPATRRALKASREAQAEATALLARAALWRVAGRPEALVARAQGSQTEQARAEAALARREALGPALLGAMQAAVLAGLALLGAQEAEAGRLGVAELAALGAALGLAIDPALGLAAAWSRWRAAQGALEALPPPEAEAPPKPPVSPPDASDRPQGLLVLQGLAVAPPGGHPTGLPLTHRLEAGSRALLEGPNGAGKSSLLKGLAGAWPHLAGVACLDGRPLSDWGPGAIAWAPQEPLLLGPSVEDDLRLFAPQAPREALAQLWAELGGPEAPGLEAPVAWLWQDRSGGQAARLALARALAARPRLLLLDEPSAHLDASGRQALLAALSAPGAFGSALVASHDPEWRAWATTTWRPWG